MVAFTGSATTAVIALLLVRSARDTGRALGDASRLDLLDIIDVSDDVVVSVTRHRGRGRESGIEMDFEVFYVHHVPGGKLARLEMFFSPEQALEAAELRE